MASFLNIIPHVIKWEGGLVYHSNEGQYTNMGIQYSTYESLSKKLLGVQPSMAHFKALKKADLQKFIEYYWNQATYNNSIRSQDAANLMFQAYWGSGSAGIKSMQRALNAAYNSNLAIDGIVGPKTVGVINSKTKSADVLYKALETRYKDLGADPQYSKYLKGWLNRLADLKPFMYAGVLIGILALIYFTHG